MPWPIPTARTIAERIAATIEAGILAVRNEVDPLALSRAVRSARGLLAQIGRAFALEVREVQDHISWWGRQYFPDTAEDEFADRHASIWGLERRAATPAIGTLTIQGAAGLVVPAGTQFAASSGTVYVSTAAATVAVNGTGAVSVVALVSGISGNLEAGILLAPVLPGTGVSRATVASDGLAGGAEEESSVDLTARTIERIRQREHGGAAFDYPTWLKAKFDVAAVAVIPEWVGRGSVGVVVAMGGGAIGRAPTAAEIEAMQIHLGRFGVAEGVRPVTARVVVVAATLTPIAMTVRLRPDTVAVRAAVTEAFGRFVSTLGDADDAYNSGPIGALIERSRLSEAISAAAGEYAHDLIVPAANRQLARAEYPVPGVITFADPA